MKHNCHATTERRQSPGVIINNNNEPLPVHLFVVQVIVHPMAPFLVLLNLLGLLTCCVSATALTYKLPPNGKECFFANVNQKGAKIAFYFAVSPCWNTDMDLITD